MVEATYFFNLGRHLPYNWNPNQVNPEIINREGAALSRQVASPFYQLLPENQMRGALRNRRTVSLQELLRPFPHYTGLTQINTPGAGERFRWEDSPRPRHRAAVTGTYEFPLGRVTRMAAGTQGREIQCNARIHF